MRSTRARVVAADRCSSVSSPTAERRLGSSCALVLELFKQGVVDLEQTESFGELMVRPLAAGERVALDVSSLEEWGDQPITETRVQEQV